MTLKTKSFILAATLAITVAIAGCGDSGGSPMPDNKDVRKENPGGQRPDVGGGPNETQGKE